MCAINGCDNAGTTTVGSGADTFQLCQEHADQTKFPRTGCRVCGKAVRIADTAIRSNQPYGPPDSFRLCMICDALAKANCASCGKIVRIGDQPIGGNQPYGEPDNLRLCLACEDLAKVECDGCRRILKVGQTQIVDSVRNHRNRRIRLCVACDDAVTEPCHCRACGAPAAYQSQTGRTALRGAAAINPVSNTATVVGRRCAVCNAGSLNSKEEARQFYDAAVQWMTGWARENGEAYPDYGVRLQWDVARDATFTTEAGGQTLGECETTTHGSAPKTYSIQVLNFIPPIAFQRTLVHELTHALTNELNIAERQKIEGFCNYVAYRYMRHLASTAQSGSDRDEATEHIKRLDDNPNERYGVDFRTIRDALLNKDNDGIGWLRTAQ